MGVVAFSQRAQALQLERALLRSKREFTFCGIEAEAETLCRS